MGSWFSSDIVHIMKKWHQSPGLMGIHAIFDNLIIAGMVLPMAWSGPPPSSPGDWLQTTERRLLARHADSDCRPIDSSLAPCPWLWTTWMRTPQAWVGFLILILQQQQSDSGEWCPRKFLFLCHCRLSCPLKCPLPSGHQHQLWFYQLW